MCGLCETLLGDLKRYDQAAYRNFTRCALQLFLFLHNRVTPRIRRVPNNYRPPGRPGAPLKPGHILAMTLRYLASGNLYSDMQYGFIMPTSSISESVREVCQAIVDEFWDEFIQTPQNEAEWHAVADEFRRRWNFHHTLGSIDGKHVPIQKSLHAGSDYWNYKKFNYIIILAVMDVNYNFLWLNIGTRGAAGDAQIWNESVLKHALVNNTLPIP